MRSNKKSQNTGSNKTNPQSNAEHIHEAAKQAEKDIKNDPELSTASDSAADLDEGEMARLEGEK